MEINQRLFIVQKKDSLQKVNIRAQLRNHVKLGVSLRVLYCAVDTDYGLGKSLGDCRSALPKG